MLDAPWAKMFRRKAIGKLRFCEELSYAEDKLFVFNFMAECSSVRTCPLPVYDYHLRAGSLGSDTSSDRHLMQLRRFLPMYADVLCRLAVKYPFCVKVNALYRKDLIGRYVCRVMNIFASRRSALLGRDYLTWLYGMMDMDSGLGLFSLRPGQFFNLLLYKMNNVDMSLRVYRFTSGILDRKNAMRNKSSRDFESSPFDRKGLFNAVHERIRHLAGTGECEVDAFCIHARDNVLTRVLRHTSKVPCPDSVVIDDVKYRMLWYRFSVTDHILVWKLRREPLFFKALVRRAVTMLEGYDVVSAHSFAGALIAAEASARFGMPYYVSWHGSDVHTFPRRNPLVLRRTKALMEGAACNFFVSRALLESSSYICADACKRVLYNGVSEVFVRFPEQDRLSLRARFGVDDNSKVVAFVGNLVAVKNVTVLRPLSVPYVLDMMVHCNSGLWETGNFMTKLFLRCWQTI